MSVLGVILVRIFRIRTEYGVIRSISPYSAWIRENADQNNAEYGQFLLSDFLIKKDKHEDWEEAVLVVEFFISRIYHLVNLLFGCNDIVCFIKCS